MAAPEITITYSDADVRNRLATILRRTGDLRPALASIGEQVRTQTELRWERQVDPDGIPWEPLSAFTLSWKRKNSRILRILESTGRLRDSISYQVFGDRVTIGTNVSYAAKHQLGINVPQRRFLGLSEADISEIILLLDNYILGT
jgi:phage virion morphogenesis protein